jgi:hypothetical protein
MPEPKWKSATRELVERQVQMVTQGEWHEILGLLANHKAEMEPLVEEVIQNGPADLALR